MFSSRSMRRASAASELAGLTPCSWVVPERSRKASSIESAPTRGVSDRIISRTSRPTPAYFAMLGFTTATCGHRSSAWNMGMAE